MSETPEIDWRKASHKERQILYRYLKAEMDRRGLTLTRMFEEAIGPVSIGPDYDSSMRGGRFKRQYAFQFYNWLRQKNPRAAANVAEELLTAEQPHAKVWQELADQPPAFLEPSTQDKLLQKQSYLIIRQIRTEIHEELAEQSRILSENIVAFADAYGLVHHPEELCSAPWNALIHIAGFICDFGAAAKHDDAAALELVRKAKIRSRVKYDVLIKLQGITVPSIRIWEAIRPIWEQIGDDRSLAQDQAKWESSTRVHWLWKQYPIYDALQNRLVDGVRSGKIKATAIQQSVISTLDPAPDGYRNLEQHPWQIIQQ